MTHAWSDIPFSAEDRANPVSWLTSLSPEHLRSWLKENLAGNRTGPLYEATIVDFENHLADLTEQSPLLLERLRGAVASLLAEWRKPDSLTALEGLIVLYQRLRASSAEFALRSLLTRELTNNAQPERHLRWLALTALVDVASVPAPEIFWRDIDDPQYAAICFRGLYSASLTNVAEALPCLLRAYPAPTDDRKLQALLSRLFRKHISPHHLPTFLPLALTNLNIDDFIRVSRLAEAIGFRIDLEMQIICDIRGGQRFIARIDDIAARLQSSLGIEQLRALDSGAVPGYPDPSMAYVDTFERQIGMISDRHA